MQEHITQTRQYWLTGLNAVSGRSMNGLSSWLINGQYEAYDTLSASATNPAISEDFILTIGSKIPFLDSIASDCNRFMSAAVETMLAINRTDHLPRSMGWVLIKTYYAAYFSANAILKMLGSTIIQLDRNILNRVGQVFQLYGNSNGLTIVSGCYLCIYHNANSKLICVKDNNTGGSHQVLWAVFSLRIRQLSNDILNTGIGALVDRQTASTRLGELVNSLSGNGRNTIAGWLSFFSKSN